MKLEERMYVRFTNYDKSCQYIGKIANINEFRETSKKNAVYVSWHNDYLFISDEDIVNASYELIDLAEVGDYVNGLPVTRICIDEETNKKYLNMYGSVSEWENEDIKSIVTKEQFNSMKYEVCE